MEKAARQLDPVGHTMAEVGLLAGLVAGALIGIAVVATGGLALGAIAVATVAAGACMGGGIGEVLGSLSFVPPITTGMITSGSPNVSTNNLPAVRAHLDTDLCAGMPPLYLPPHATNLVAQGSSTVRINGQPASRRGDKMVCGAAIADGSPNVRIGGSTATTDEIESEVPAWLNWTVMGVGIAAAVVLVGPVVAVAGLIGSVLGGEGGAWLGGELFGQGSDGQKLMALGGSFLGGAVFGGAAKGMMEEPVTAPVSERPCCGDPVDVVTGEVLMWKTDFVLPGALPLELKRNYASGLPHSSCFGPHWASTWGQYVESAGEDATYYSGDGREIVFKIPASDRDKWVACATVNKVRLRQVADGFEVRDEQGRMLRFARRAGDRRMLTGISERNGNVIRFSYDASDALREVAHSGGYVLKVEGTATQVQRVTLGGTELVRYEYGDAGMLVGVVNGTGLPFRYFYDDQGRVTRWEDRKGTWHRYRFDDHGRCVETGGEGQLYHWRFTYDETKRSTGAIDPQDGLTVYTHNERRQVVERRDARGGITRTEWDERGNKLKETDPAGRSVTREYDADGNLTVIEDGLGRHTQIEYDEAGLPVKLVDAGGKQWTRGYDERGNLIESKGPDGLPWRYDRDELGNLARVVDPEGRSRKFGYDRRGLLSSVTDWKGQRTELSVDAQGRVIERVDALGRRMRFVYDKQGKLAEAVLADGTHIRWEYDTEGNLVRRAGADGKAYRYSYGRFDLLTEVRKPAGGRLQLRYDTWGRLRRVENELRQTWWYEYNATGQVAREIDFHGREQRYEYDLSGLCVKRVNGGGEEIAQEWDAAGQLAGKRCSDGSVSEFEYDPLGRVIRAIADGLEVTLERDDFGRVTKETQPGGGIVSEYDLRGLRVKRNTGNGFQTGWELDSNGQVSALRDDLGTVLEFGRDAIGRETERKMRGGVVLRQGYDALDRLKSQWAGTEAAFVDREYEYNVNGDPVAIQDKRWGRSEFGYDDDGRIARAEKERGKSEAFEYDAAGNIIQRVVEHPEGFGHRTRDYGEDGRLTRSGRTEYRWDTGGRLAEKREGERRWRYEWTSEDRLKSVETPEGELWSYQYDAFGRRVEKTGPKGSVKYVWDGAVVAEEVRGKAVIAWEYEPRTFRPLGKRENKWKFDVCVTDQVGTPRELLNESGKIVWRAVFTTWGEPDEQAEKETDCPIRFQGQWLDEESGLHYNRFRYYDPATGNYVSPDPIGMLGGTRNYGYVHNPLAWVDPLGLAGTCTTEPLSAFGNKAAPREPRIEGYNSTPGKMVDMVPNENGMVGPTDPPTGASTFGDPNQAPLTGHYHTLPAGTELPEGLGVNPDGSDVLPGSTQPPTHNTIYPTQEMPPEEFVQKYNNLPWQYGGKK